MHYQNYAKENDIDAFLKGVEPLVPPKDRYIFIGMKYFVRNAHMKTYNEFLTKNNLTIPEDM